MDDQNYPMQTLSANSLKGAKLIATDMDGTLTQAGKFTPALLQALTGLASAGIPVLIVTGRSAGWVNGLASYLPIAGAIAENGGLFYSKNGASEEWLVPITNVLEHRQQLAEMFHRLQSEFSQIQESNDNQFRLTDWTFDVQGLSPEELAQMRDRCHKQGWGFTYSTVQSHIKLKQQEKAIGLTQVVQRYFPQYELAQIVTVGDSPNDESLFDPQLFPRSVGVANIRHYVDRLTYQPAYVTQASEAEGFVELAQLLLP